MLHAMEVNVAELKRAVEVQHGCKATVFQSMPIKKTFSGKTVWEGVVFTFSLTGHPTAKRAYAWSSPIGGSDKRRLFAVLTRRRLRPRLRRCGRRLRRKIGGRAIIRNPQR